MTIKGTEKPPAAHKDDVDLRLKYSLPSADLIIQGLYAQPRCPHILQSLYVPHVTSRLLT